MWVSEMTRFGMEPENFRTLAELIRDVLVDGKPVQDEVIRLRSRFQDLRYCFSDAELDSQVEQLHRLI